MRVRTLLNRIASPHLRIPLRAFFMASFIAASFGAAGCSSCEKSREVPFGLNNEPAEAEHEGEGSGLEDESSESDPGAESSKKLESLKLEAGTDRVRIEGVDYRAPGSAIHLLLEMQGLAKDASAVILESDDARYRLKLLEKREKSLKAVEIASFERAEDCAFKDGALALPDPEHLTYSFTEECAFGEGAAAGFANLFPSPWLRKAIRIDAPREEGGASFSIALESADRDEDGHLDLLARIESEGLEPIELSWLNRPGGLMLVDLEPAQSLARLEEVGKSAIEPAAAASAARALLTLSSALCRESERPRLRVDELRGLPCGKDYSRVAEGLIVGELLLRGEIEAALSLARELRERGDEELNAILREAFKLLPAAAISLHQLPLPSALGADAWLRGVAFDEEGALLIGGVTPSRIVLDGDEPEVSQIPEAPFPSRDLLDRYGLVSIETACYGSRAGVRQLHIPLDELPPRTKMLSIDEGSGCDPGAPREEPWEIVGWAPQGLVFERGSLRRIVPLNVDAAPAGDPFDLGDEEPLPSPILGPRVSRDGETRLIVIPSAILIVREGRRSLVIRHEAWGDAPKIRAAAISPSGDRLAAVVGGELYFGKLSGH